LYSSSSELIAVTISS